MYQYHVDFEPEIDSKRMRIGLLRPHDPLFDNNKAFDGRTLFSMKRLDNEVEKKKIFFRLNSIFLIFKIV